MATARDEEVARAVESVDGVDSASVRLPGGVGPGHLRVVFAEGHDRSDVAARVARLLDERFGLHISAEAIERLASDAEAPTAGDDERRPEADVDAEQAARVREPASTGDAAPGPQPPATRAHAREAGESARTRQPAVEQAHAARPRRPLIDRLELNGAGLELEAHAVLSLNGATVEGVATGAATRQGRLRAAANATVSALQHLLERDVKLEIDALDVLGEPHAARIVVTVTLLTWEGSETHVGVALVRNGEPEHAAMRATLDALNRRVAPLLRS